MILHQPDVVKKSVHAIQMNLYLPAMHRSIGSYKKITVVSSSSNLKVRIETSAPSEVLYRRKLNSRLIIQHNLVQKLLLKMT